MKLGLRTKIIIMFFVFISFPLTILGIVSYNMTSKSLQSVIEEQLRQMTEETSISIHQNIDGVDKCLKILSYDEGIAKLAEGDTAFTSEVFEYLNDVQKDNEKIIETLIITDASGKGLLVTGDEKLMISLQDHDYIKEALKGSRAQSELMVSKITNKNIVSVAYPLKNNGKIVGTIIANIKFNTIENYISKVKIGQTGYAYMIDKTGLFLSHPQKEKVLKDSLFTSNDNELKEIIEKMKSGKEGEGYYSYGGKKKYVKFVPVNNWIIAITVDYNDYMSPAIKIKHYTEFIVLFSIAISMLLASIFSTKNIVNPIKVLEELMLKAGNGDLTVKSTISTKDEIQMLSEYFNQMVGHQADMVGNMKKYSQELAASSEESSASAEEMSGSAEEIATSIQHVATNAEIQNKSIVEISEVLVQLSSLIQIANNRAEEAQGNSKATMEKASKGREKVEKTVQAMNNIQKSSIETGEKLKFLEDISKKVTGIIGTINEISDHTNLLALNASIEAARAGEHGKGFAVVAEEVRKLSEETNNKSNEISLLIKEMVLQIESAVEAMNLGDQAVKSGVMIVNETDQSFIFIIEALEKIVKDIRQIVDVTREEVASSDHIIKLIDAVATITETTALSGEQVAAAAEEQSSVIQNIAYVSEQISVTANSLNDIVLKFKI